MLRAFMHHLALILALGLCASSTHAQTGPDAVITAIYKTSRTGNDNMGSPKLYSRRLQELIDADARSTPEGAVGKIDWDGFVDGNNSDISALRIVLLRRAGTHAQVRARFKNH